MTYRLKDRVLQNHLDAISNGEFSRCLQTELQDIRGSGTTDADYRVFFGFMSGRAELVNRFSMLLYEHEIEAIPENNPNEWNIWPKVAPPKDVCMRVELRTKGTDLDTPEPRLGKVYFQGCGYWDGRKWIVLGCHVLPDSAVRYQPWE